MKKILISFLLIFPLISLTFAQESYKAKVTGIADGETITVINKEKRQLTFQIAGIDAPDKDQDFGADAKKILSDLVLNQTVTISNIKKDCLDRMSASVMFQNKDLSFSLVKLGNAWADTTCQNNESLAKEELTAKENKIGLWKNLNPIRPSEFRKLKELRQEKVSQTPSRRIYEGLALAAADKACSCWNIYRHGA